MSTPQPTSLIAITRCVPSRGIPLGQPPAPPAALPGASIIMAAADPLMTRPELLAFVRQAAADAPDKQLAIVSTIHDRIDTDYLDAAGPKLRGICNFAVGFDNIDRAACAARGVQVANIPDAVTEGTANIAFALLLAVARKIIESDAFVRSGAWARSGPSSPVGWMGQHLSGQTMLIVGAGRIGKAVALRALAFGMRIIYTARTRHLDFEGAPIAARHVELDEGLVLADVVSMHTPLTPATKHLLDVRRLSLLKPSAIVINTSRGPTIDEVALVDALKHGRLWGAGLDVLENEPQMAPGLAELRNVVLTPHIGSSEQYWREEMTRMAIENVVAMLKGQPAPNAIKLS